jgi:natural product precursor
VTKNIGKSPVAGIKQMRYFCKVIFKFLKYMKKLGKLKLNVLSETNLQDREMNRLRGGERCCTCSCYWYGRSGSSSSDNSKANYNIPSLGGGSSTHGSNCYVYCCNATYDDSCEQIHSRTR